MIALTLFSAFSVSNTFPKSFGDAEGSFLLSFLQPLFLWHHLQVLLEGRLKSRRKKNFLRRQKRRNIKERRTNNCGEQKFNAFCPPLRVNTLEINLIK
jgi:hypothetical protein